MAKRILHIIPTLDRCGAEKQLTLLASGLPRDKFDVHVCALTRGGPLLADLQQAEVPTTVIGKRWKYDPSAYFRLKRHIADLKPDLVQTWLFAGNSYGRSAAFACEVPHVLASERCVDPWKRSHQFMIDRYLARRTDHIIVNGTGVRDFYVKHRIPADKIKQIPNGIAPARETDITRDALLQELGLPDNALLIGLVARLWPQKLVKDAIWAADLLKVIRDDVHLLIIGDGPERGRLFKYRDGIDIADKVHFLGERDDVWRLLPHFDLSWSTSAYEGQSNSIMEAMAAGVPVVATDVPGNGDLVLNDETGVLIPFQGANFRRRRADFARQSNILLEDPVRRYEMSQASVQRMLREFSIERMVDRYAALYRQLLEA